MDCEHDWLTVHRVRFHAVVDGTRNPLPGPATARFWRFAPMLVRGPDGFLTNKSDAWGGFALHSTRQEAEAVFNDPEAHLPFLDDAAEAWHALVIPYAHRGSVKWGKRVQENSAIRIAPADPKGPLVVFTTAGYTDPGPKDASRMKAFISGILDVTEHYGTLPGNLRRGVFEGAGVDGREGCSITLWRDDVSMMEAAYQGGAHKLQLDRHRAAPLFDRSSFTRGRVVVSKGAWDGADPIGEMAG